MTSLLPSDLPSVLASSPDQISQSRRAVLAFAERMVTAGTVVVTSPTRPDLIEHRIAARDVDRPGYTVVFLSVVDGEPEVTSIDFDLDDRVSARHLPHADGLGLTMCDALHRPLVTYRIG